METKIKRWGNSYGIVIPKTALAQMELHDPANQYVTLMVTNKALVVKPKKLASSIDELFAGFDYDAYNQESSEVDWGSPVGDEIW